jgi:hypothetical protein
LYSALSPEFRQTSRPPRQQIDELKAAGCEGAPDNDEIERDGYSPFTVGLLALAPEVARDLAMIADTITLIEGSPANGEPQESARLEHVCPPRETRP